MHAHWHRTQDMQYAPRVLHFSAFHITMSPTGSQECRENLDRIMAACSELGVPLAADKLERPSTCLTFLGIEIHTRSGQLRLPADMLGRLKELLAQWYPTGHDLQNI